MSCNSFLLEFRLFNFTDDSQGTVEFKGNLLFTHFSEINSPKIGSPTEMGGGLAINLPESLHQNDETLNSGKL